ncbi:hypothetical protein FRB99_001465 [Tulasnella sp. 403]|nr:hypothetical protein FRB99_001465 [Tulasnella sp. 403]
MVLFTPLVKLSLCFLALGHSVFAAVADISSVPRQSTDNIVPNVYIVELSAGSLPSKRDSDADLLNLASIQTVVAVYPVFLLKAPKFYTNTTTNNPNNPNIPADVVSSHKMTGINKLQAQGYNGNGIKVAVIDSGVDYTLPVLGGGFGGNNKIYTGYDFVGDNFDGTAPPQPDNDPMDNCFGHGTAIASIIAGNYDPTFKFIGAAPKAKIGAYRVFGCPQFTTDDIVIQAMIRAYLDGNDILTLSLSDNSGWSESILAVVASRIAQKGRIVTSSAANNGIYGPFFTASPGTGNQVISVASVDAQQYTLQTASVSTGHAPIPYLSQTVLPIPANSPIWVPSDVFGCATITGAPSNPGQYVFVVSRGNCAFATKISNILAVGGRYMLVYNNGPGYETVALSGIVAALISIDDGQYLVSQFQAGKTVTLSFPPNQPVTVDNVLTGGVITDTSAWGPTNELFMKPNVAGVGGYVLTAWPAALGGWALNSGTSFASPLVAGASALLLQAKGKGPFSGYITSQYTKTLFEQTAIVGRTTMGDDGPINPLALQGAGLINAYNAVNYKTFVSPSVLYLNDSANADYKQTITIQNLSPSIQTYTLTHVPAATVLTWSGTQINSSPVLSGASADVKFSKTTVKVLPLVPTTVTVTFTRPAGLDPATFPVYSGQIRIDSGQESLGVSYLGLAANMRDMQVIDTSTFFFGLKLPLVLNNKDGTIQSGPVTYTFQGNDYPLLYWRLTTGTRALHIDLVDANIKFKPTYTKRDTLDAPAELPDALKDATKRALPDLSANIKGRGHHRHLMRNARRTSSGADDLNARGLNLSVKFGGEAHHERGNDKGYLFWDTLWDWLNPNQPKPGTFEKVPIVGQLYEAFYVSRSTTDPSTGFSAISLQNRQFANGSTIPNGSYRILMRALKITGDPTKGEDYESWLSPVINYAGAP